MPMMFKWHAGMTLKYHIKIAHVSEKGNLVCKTISKKSLAALKADGFIVRRIPNGSYVICKKKN